ncbi:hypothetical protein CLV59_106383 [Chitinophaga dinghuensis]|uniref:Uncharacterized protein n=1 Tax=Chitinophaga dinghuensis TaxID=1539050 RepID=A0A327VV18_9BACT|nr:hypothetical protein [Chitinophaga dinghuensis]RAJ79322.1 hypothetical protein CLV59_106383 [Chitinophaga dinghuensis]
MSITRIIGIIASAVIIICAFLPWSEINDVHLKHLIFTGVNTVGSSYGEPGKLNIFLSVVALAMFALRKKWTLRVNLFVCGFLLAWTFRNMMIFSRCEIGICPQTHIALYISVAAALAAFLSVLFTRVDK